MAKVTSSDMNARRNEVLTPEKRKAIAKKAAQARWAAAASGPAKRPAAARKKAKGKGEAK